MLLDSQGRPVGPSTLELAKVLEDNMRAIAMMLGQVQKGMFLSELKINFLLKELTENGQIKEGLDERWQVFAKEEQERLRDHMEAEAKEVQKEVPVDKIIENLNL